MRKMLIVFVLILASANTAYSFSLNELKQFAQRLKSDTRVQKFEELTVESAKSALSQDELRGVFLLAYNRLTLDSAVTLFDKIADIPNRRILYDYARLFKARILFEKGNYAGADKLFSEIPLAEAKYYIAQIYYRRGNYKQALNIIAKLKNLPGVVPQKAALLKAMCLEKSGDFSNALDIYSNQYLDSDFDTFHSFILYRIVKIYEETGDIGRATEYAQDFLRQYPNAVEYKELEKKYKKLAIVQVAALSTEDRANRLKRRIEKVLNYEVSIDQTVISGKTLFRVKIGPVSADEADTISKIIDKKFNVNSRVIMK